MKKKNLVRVAKKRKEKKKSHNTSKQETKTLFPAYKMPTGLTM